MSESDPPPSDEAALPLPTFAPEEKVCGNCKLWRPHSVDAAKGLVGQCRMQPNRGLFPPGAPLCDKFAPRGVASPGAPDAPPSAPRPRHRALPPLATVVRTGSGGLQPGSPRGQETVDLLGEGASMTRDELMQVFLEAAGLSDVPLAPRWEGGTVRLIPGNPELQSKDLPVDALFHKVVMVRDRLRTLEQRLNAHPKLSDAEKVELQQYITRCYGSLTSFNLLFHDKRHHFVGQKGED